MSTIKLYLAVLAAGCMLSATAGAQNFWQQVTSPTQGTIHTFLIDSADVILAGTVNGIYKSTNDGSSWTILGLSNKEVYSIKSYGGFLFASTFLEGIFRSTNNGATWAEANSGLFSMSTGHLAIDLTGTIYAPTFDGLFKSTNNGNNWSLTTLTEQNLRTVYVDAINNIYAGGLEGRVFKSTNNGQNWTLALNIPGNSIVAVFSHTSNGYVYISTQGNAGGVFRSTNGGISWNNSLSPLTTLYFAENSVGHIFLSTWEYVYRTTNSGNSWDQISSGLTSSVINGIAVNSGDRVFVGTPSGAVFKSAQPAIMNLKALIQGFYDPASNKMTEDTARTYLRNASLPYSMVDSSKSVLDSTGTGNFNFSNAVDTVPYYLVVKHRNGLETWSASGNPFISGSLTYDFTNASSQAFGNNQILKGSKYCIYNGDADQNGAIDLTDLVIIYKDASTFAAGYLNTDLNGDMFIDISDEIIAYNNAADFVQVIRP